jgi:small subunit ribosomal protein S4
VKHGHFIVNGRRVDVPSFRVNPGDEISLTERGKKAARVLQALEGLEARTVPSWLEIDKDTKVGRVTGPPVREELTLPVQEQLIVEFYSR